MKIAISINKNNEISNLLDASDYFVIIDLDNQVLEINSKEFVDFHGEDAFSILAELKQQGIELLFCGNISCCLKRYLNVLKINCYSFLKGDFLSILEYFKNNSGTFKDDYIIKNERCKHKQNKEENYVFRQKLFAKRQRKQRKNGQLS